MMSKTHIAVGVASALAIAQTGSVESCVAAMIGGSIGGIIADCDITPSRAHKDALIGRIIVIAVSVVSLAIDYWYGAGVCDYLVGSLGVWLIVGIALFAALTFVGGHTDHRSFTHSLVGMAAFCGSFYLICEPLLMNWKTFSRRPGPAGKSPGLTATAWREIRIMPVRP